MLVGRQIVDRAKIQRIIFEFDYYEKAFHQFYDTYRTTPGGLTQKECMKHSVFQGKIKYIGSGPKETTYSHEVYCNGMCNSKHMTSPKIYDSLSYKGAFHGLANLLKAGLASEDAVLYTDETTGYDNTVHKSSAAPHVNSDNNVYIEIFARSSFDSNVFFSYAGFAPYGGYDYKDVDYGYTQRVRYMPGINNLVTKKHEFNNNNYYQAINNHSALIFFDIPVDIRYVDGQGFSHSTSVGGNSEKANGAISSKQMSELDAKIDDGRPGSGKLLALKTGRARRSGATETDITQTCYDKTFEEIDTAIYNSDTNLKYGCNIVKVMEDVK